MDLHEYEFPIDSQKQECERRSCCCLHSSCRHFNTEFRSGLLCSDPVQRLCLELCRETLSKTSVHFRQRDQLEYFPSHIQRFYYRLPTMPVTNHPDSRDKRPTDTPWPIPPPSTLAFLGENSNTDKQSDDCPHRSETTTARVRRTELYPASSVRWKLFCVLLLTHSFMPSVKTHTHIIKSIHLALWGSQTILKAPITSHRRLCCQ